MNSVVCQLYLNKTRKKISVLKYVKRVHVYTFNKLILYKNTYAYTYTYTTHVYILYILYIYLYIIHIFI